jgi:rubredoxin-NAD+ reductase
MPVAVKTPALPLLLALPVPGTLGEWQLAEEAVWQFIGEGGQCLGFVLAGKQTSQRGKALQWLQPA